MYRPLIALATVHLLLLMATRPAGALTRIVPTGYPTIQSGIDISASGDTVLVQPGTYVENIWIDRDIAVLSEAGPPVTIIDGGSPVNPDHASTVRIDAGTVEGFDIRNGTGWFEPPQIYGRIGGGVFVMGPCVVRNNWIHDNHMSPQPGTYVADGAAVGMRLNVNADLLSNRIYHNRIDAVAGSVIWVGGGAGTHVDGNEIFDNQTPGGSAVVSFREAEVTDNIIACNNSHHFIIVWTAGLFRGNTVVANWCDELDPAIIASSYDDLECTLQGNNITHNVGPGLNCRQNDRPPSPSPVGRPRA